MGAYRTTATWRRSGSRVATRARLPTRSERKTSLEKLTSSFLSRHQGWDGRRRRRRGKKDVIQCCSQHPSQNERTVR